MAGSASATTRPKERTLRGIALGRRNWTFAGSQRGADRAAIMLTMITTCRLNDIDPKAWLADVLARIADLPASRLHELLPWKWKLLRQADKRADQHAACPSRNVIIGFAVPARRRQSSGPRRMRTVHLQCDADLAQEQR